MRRQLNVPTEVLAAPAGMGVEVGRVSIQGDGKMYVGLGEGQPQGRHCERIWRRYCAVLQGGGVKGLSVRYDEGDRARG